MFPNWFKDLWDGNGSDLQMPADQLEETDAMPELEALLGHTDNQPERVSQIATDVHEQTGLPYESIGEAFVVMARLGQDTEELATLPAYISTSRKTRVELDKLIENVLQISYAYNIDLGDPQRILDPLENATKEYMIDLSELLEGLQFATIPAQAIGLPLSEVVDDVAREGAYIQSNGREAGRYYQGKYEAYLEGIAEQENDA